MRQVITYTYYCTRNDYEFVKKQMKDKGTKIGKVAKELQLTTKQLYEVLVGKRKCSDKIFAYFTILHDYKFIFDNVESVVL